MKDGGAHQQMGEVLQVGLIWKTCQDMVWMSSDDYFGVSKLRQKLVVANNALFFKLIIQFRFDNPTLICTGKHLNKRMFSFGRESTSGGSAALQAPLLSRGTSSHRSPVVNFFERGLCRT